MLFVDNWLKERWSRQLVRKKNRSAKHRSCLLSTRRGSGRSTGGRALPRFYTMQTGWVLNRPNDRFSISSLRDYRTHTDITRCTHHASISSKSHLCEHLYPSNIKYWCVCKCSQGYTQMTKSCGSIYQKNKVIQPIVNRILQKQDTTLLQLADKTFRECYRTYFWFVRRRGGYSALPVDSNCVFA